MTPCPTCRSTGWCCEAHPDRPWEGVLPDWEACCDAPGMPCPDCEKGRAIAAVDLSLRPGPDLRCGWPFRIPGSTTTAWCNLPAMHGGERCALVGDDGTVRAATPRFGVALGEQGSEAA